MTSSLRIQSSKADSNTWDSFIKKWTEAEVDVRSVLPGLWRKRTGLLLSGPKSSFQIKVHFAFHLEIRVPESGGRVERHRIHVS